MFDSSLGRHSLGAVLNENLMIPVAYYQNRELILGLASPSEDGLWQGVDEKGEKFSFAAARLVLKGKAIDSILEPAAYLVDLRKDIEIERRKLSELIPELLAQASATLEEIAVKLFAQTNAQAFAIYMVLVSDPQSYHHKHGVFRLNTAEERDLIVAAQEAKEERAIFLEEVSRFIAGAKLSDKVQHLLFQELPLLAQDSGAKDLQRLVAGAYPDIDFARAVQKLRQKCGEMDTETDPLLASAGIPLGFSDLVMAEPLITQNMDSGRVQIFSIDDEETRDYDDAISFEKVDKGFRLGIHVSNVASRIELQGLLHEEAARRGASFYAVNKVIPMLPSRYSEQELSLIMGTQRPVVSMYLELDEHSEILSRSIKSEVLPVRDNLSYRQVDRQITQEPFASIMRICNKHKAMRDVDVPGDKQRYYYYLRMVKGNLQLKMIDNASPARMMVEELMIIFNSGLAAYARERGLPVIYRNVNRYAGTGDDSFPSQAYLSTRAEFHPGIGSAAYLHATSPIRRYTDLLNHYQLLSSLEGRPAPFSEEDLLAKIVGIEKKLYALKDLSHRSERYWCLKYLAAKYLHEPLDVCYRGALRDLIRLEIIPWGFQILAQCDHFPKGDVFKIAVHGIDWEKGFVMADIL